MATKKWLISLDHALQAVSENYRSDMPKHELDVLIATRKRLKALPTVNTMEVLHGEWVNVIHAVVDTTGYCTRCGEQAVWRTRNKPYAICPNCGARMKDGDGND